MKSFYFFNVNLPEKLSLNDQKDLFKKLHDENISIKEKIKIRKELINSNLRLVRYVLRKLYYYFEFNVDEFVSYGIEGLNYAIDYYDLENNEFSTYAFRCIEGFILKAIPSQYGMSRTFFYDFFKAKSKVEKIYERKYISGDLEMLELILDFMSLNDKQKEYLKSVENIISYDINIDVVSDYVTVDNDSGEAMLYDLILKDDRYIFNLFLNDLSLMEKNVIVLRYGLNGDGLKTFEEIGKILNLSKNRCWQLEKNAFVKIRNFCSLIGDEDYIKDYIDNLTNLDKIADNKAKIIKK